MADKETDNKTSLVRNLAEILVEKDLSEIEVRDADIRIRLRRGATAQAIVAAPPAMVATPTVATVASQPSAAEPAASTPSNGTQIPSPMVGTVYLAPSPDASAYISVGSKVKSGDTLLIIEAMKTMNHIPATCSGTITEILVDDKQPVEFGEILVVIE